MGSAISSLAKKLTGDSNEENKAKLAQTKELLDTMTELVKSKIDIWTSSVLLSGKTDKKISPERIIAKNYEIRASSDFNKDRESKDGTGPTTLFTGIKDCIKKFTDGKYADGIVSSLETVIGSVIGSASGVATEQENYIITAGSNGALMRIDYYCYYRKIGAAQFFSNEFQEMLGVGYIISSPNYKDVDPITIKTIVELSYSSSSVEEKANLEQIITKSITEAREWGEKFPAKTLFSMQGSPTLPVQSPHAASEGDTPTLVVRPENDYPTHTVRPLNP